MGAFTQMSKVVVGIAVLAGVAFMSVPDVLTGVSSGVLKSDADALAPIALHRSTTCEAVVASIDCGGPIRGWRELA